MSLVSRPRLASAVVRAFTAVSIALTPAVPYLACSAARFVTSTLLDNAFFAVLVAIDPPGRVGGERRPGPTMNRSATHRRWQRHDCVQPTSPAARDRLARSMDHVVDPADAAEATLLAGLRAGDDAAFETLVRTNSPRLLTVARRILGSEEDARDALQEA